MQESLYTKLVHLVASKVNEVISVLRHRGCSEDEIKVIWALVNAPVNIDVYIQSKFKWTRYSFNYNGERVAIEFEGEQDTTAQRFIRMFLHLKSYRQFLYRWENEWKGREFTLNGDMAQMFNDQYSEGHYTPDDDWYLH